MGALKVVDLMLLPFALPRDVRLSKSVGSLRILHDELIHPRIFPSEIGLELIDLVPFVKLARRKGALLAYTPHSKRCLTKIDVSETVSTLSRLSKRSLACKLADYHIAIEYRCGTIETYRIDIPSTISLLPTMDAVFGIDTSSSSLYIYEDGRMEIYSRCRDLKYFEVHGSRIAICIDSDELTIVLSDGVSGIHAHMLGSSLNSMTISSVTSSMLSLDHAIVILKGIDRLIALSLSRKDSSACIHKMELSGGIPKVLDQVGSYALLSLGSEIAILNLTDNYSKVLHLRNLMLGEIIAASLSSDLELAIASDGTRIAVIIDPLSKNPKAVILRDLLSSVRSVSCSSNSVTVCGPDRCFFLEVYPMLNDIEISGYSVNGLIDCVAIGNVYACLSRDKIVLSKRGACFYSVSMLDDSHVLTSSNCVRSSATGSLVSMFSTIEPGSISSIPISLGRARALLEIVRRTSMSKRVSCELDISVSPKDFKLRVGLAAASTLGTTCVSLSGGELDLLSYINIRGESACIDIDSLERDLATFGLSLTSVEAIDVERGVGRELSRGLECVKLDEFDALLLGLAIGSNRVTKVAIPLCLWTRQALVDGSDFSVLRKGCVSYLSIPRDCIRVVDAKLAPAPGGRDLEVRIEIENACGIPIPIALDNGDVATIPPRSTSRISARKAANPFGRAFMVALEPRGLISIEVPISVVDLLRLAKEIALRVLQHLGGNAEVFDGSEVGETSSA